MKKLLLTLTLILATGTITNANTMDPCNDCIDIFYDFMTSRRADDMSTEDLQWAFYYLCDDVC